MVDEKDAVHRDTIHQDSVRRDSVQDLAHASVELKLAVLTERVTGFEQAYGLNADEIQRRLTELNHAHEKQVRDQATYIERRVFETTIADLTKWRDEINAAISETDSKFVPREAFNTHVRDKDLWRESVNGQLSVLAGRSTAAGNIRTLIFQLLTALFGLLSLYLLFQKVGGP